ncbi:protein adenylyltransferase SelO family protein [Sphingomonas sp. GCM10030256]|uniref:protein adenylyltransferase SelO family protein n=1 Tax=Sphingomonas sp. GCM10030256 TaxID=3273427 RepID=UPI0036086E5D
MPPTQAYRPDPAILELGPAFYDPVEPARFPQAVQRFRNERWAQEVGLGGLSDAEWSAHFHRFEPLPANLPQPLALRYHGHQFRQYNPDLGDGRGFLFGQLRDGRDRLLDLGTKGSGQTPWSRRGDGRLTLKGAVREVLATEMLEALGVNTSKTFAVFETGEALVRGDEPSPTRSAVLTRLGHGHVRIGTFQRFAFFEDAANLARLTRYCLASLYNEEPVEDDGANAVRLFDLVASGTARLAASYIAAGFVHGVLNSDNIAMSCESFDYGPWRFTPDWDPGFTAAYFDHSGLYAFGRQPEAIQWDVAQLAGCLAFLAEAPPLSDILADWSGRFHAALGEALVRRLGVALAGEEADRELARAIVGALETKRVGIDRLFFDWRGGRVPADPTYQSTEFEELAAALRGREQPAEHSYWSDANPCSMHIDEVEAIWAAIAEADDWQPFEAKVAAVRRMGEAMSQPGEV